jgi:CDP-glucose 4,6-dehydratase
METLVKPDHLYQHFSGKKVFVTGHTGFKGTWLVAMLHKLGARIKGYSLPPEDEGQGFFAMIDTLNGIDSVFADIRDIERLRAELLDFSPDYVFHLAAQALVLRSYKEPEYTFDVNVNGTVNLLHALVGMPKPCSTLVVTTDKVYANPGVPVFFKETDSLGGHDPYSASKACAELAVQSMRDSYFSLPTFSNHQKGIAVARAGNVIGGGDWNPHRIVPDMARSILHDQPIYIRNPNAVRPWQHVLEPLHGYLQLAVGLNADPAKFGRAFNFGPLPGDHLPVLTLVQQAISRWGKGEYSIAEERNKPHEANYLQLDIGLASKEIGWHPRLRAEEAICWTIDWYKQDPSVQFDFTLQQIEQYLSLWN